MTKKKAKTIEIKPNQKREGKAFGCSEVFWIAREKSLKKSESVRKLKTDNDRSFFWILNQ